MTQEEYDSLTPYYNLMKTIVVNAAASNLPIAYRELIIKLNKVRGHSICNCSSGLFTGTSRLYNEYVAYEAENKPKPSPKKNKRKSQDSL